MRGIRHFVALGVLAGCCPPEPAKTVALQPPKPETKELAEPGEGHLKNMRQLTFGADNAEAYWSWGGDKLIFQTNHAPYQCDQIEEMDVATGAPGKLVSTGSGRTTCSFFLKGDQEIIYASTHAWSPQCPTPPDMSKGYYWGLFEYDIYRANADGTNLRRLTDTPGYDAEDVVCAKDGSILFTSMRSGDPELWRMDADGKNPRQITNMVGYDGGGAFSPDCSHIVWRASRPTGKDLDEYKDLLAHQLVKPTKMDLWVANADGTDARQITYLPGASFGPAFFPDGRRIIFASNYLSPRGPEFDLYAIDYDGSHLEKLTTEPSFDGFPMFSPDGTKLAFSSNRRDVVAKGSDEVYRMTGGVAGVHDTNVFVADWSDEPRAPYQPESAPVDRYHDAVTFLADDAQDGRGIGTQGLARSADYVQKQFADAGVEPGGSGGSWRQTFEIVTEVKRGDATAVTIDGKPIDGGEFAPETWSAATKPVTAQTVNAGWGIVDKDLKRDDLKGLSLKGRIAIVHRFVPADMKLDPSSATTLGDLRRKAFAARNAGAVGMIVVDDGDLKADEVPLPALTPGRASDAIGQSSDAGIPVVVLTRKAAAALATGSHKVTMQIALDYVRTPTDNVIGVIHGTGKQPGYIVIGAHVDHLGMGGPDALDPNVHAVHNGADDNASGVAALLEVARTLAAHKDKLDRDVVVVAFSGEEEGDLGSSVYVKSLGTNLPMAMINMDMVGRMRNDQLHVNGGDSATEWKELVAPACAAARVVCTIGGSGYGPSDHMMFYTAGVPVIFLFTGSHTDYHTATDDSDKINAAGGAQVAKIVADVAIATAAHAPLTYVKAPPEPMGGDGPRRASLGTVPSYDEDPNRPPGMVLSDVVPDGPAAKAGLKGGDRIVKLDDTEIRSVNDLMFVLQGAKAGTQVRVTFVRDGKTQVVTATYGLPRGRH
jgi:Tol biopolymer transport system component